MKRSLAVLAKDERAGIVLCRRHTLCRTHDPALKNAGPDLTRDTFITEMEKIRGFKGIGPEINFKPFDPNDIYSRQGTSQSFIVQCLAGGKSKKLTDWITLD